MSRVVCPYCPRRFASVAESRAHVSDEHDAMLRLIELPPLEIDPVSRRATEMAEGLLEAFYAQDEREAHVIRKNASKARTCARRARDRMTETFEREFPRAEPSQAKAAGEAFVDALFLHDEIENWEFIEQLLTADELADVLLSDTTASYPVKPATDPRWDRVEEYLSEACRLVGVDEDYADKQTQFWRLHGQIHEYWEETAHEAHAIKLRAMVPDATDRNVDVLSQYFVAGVKLHDSWGHQDRTRDLNDVVDLVAKYYQKVFELRAVDQTPVDPIAEHHD